MTRSRSSSLVFSVPSLRSCAACARGASAAELHATWQSLPRRRPATCYESIVQAWRAACTEAAVGERILVIGSFLTVGEVLRDLAAREDPTALRAGTWTRS